MLNLFSKRLENDFPPPLRTLQEQVIVERTVRGVYQLFFKDEQTRPIFLGDSPSTINWESPIAVATSVSIEFDQFPRKERKYFGIQEADGTQYIVSERRLPLKGANNFRDLGGVELANNRKVQWGKIYRSDKISKLRRKDLRYLQQLGIQAVCDFRNDIEVKKDPDRLPENATYYRTPIGDKEGKAYRELIDKVKSGTLTGAQAKLLFLDVMMKFADVATDDFKPVVKKIIAQETPLLFHCSGGKDRTGFAAAVVLAALGASRETIMQEYLMSNFYRYKSFKKTARKLKIFGLENEIIGYLFMVHEDYLNAVYEVIEEKYGSMDAYLETEFGITPTVRQQLIQQYTYEGIEHP